MEDIYSGKNNFKNGNQKTLNKNDGNKRKWKTTFITIGYDNGKFIDCVLYGQYSYGRYDALEGEQGYLKNYL